MIITRKNVIISGISLFIIIAIYYVRYTANLYDRIFVLKTDYKRNIGKSLTSCATLK